MAVPRRRHSKMRARTRKANWKLSAINLTECPQCHELKLSHRVCKNCGYYDGKEAVKAD
ncbi:MAG: 50S ribosomal protein L32, partial [Clostridiales bacterium]|nr:50S ribosomal protein L32 [Clostridiales bacterium]MBP3940917.1 50S ribosomal protein L32 [Christensenellaceae bacterium]MBR3841913.1 50S ribosomal protein L32 [Christensenellaceae bacterium]